MAIRYLNIYRVPEYLSSTLNIYRVPEYLSDLCTLNVQVTWNSVQNIWT